MRNRIAIGITACLLLNLIFASAAEAADQGIEIRINGIPLEEAIDTAGGMFADAVEENVSEMIDGLSDVFADFAQGFSESMGEIGDALQADSVAPLDYFCYSNSGSSTCEIYSYEVGRDADSGEWMLVCELHCGYDKYTLSADEELLHKLAGIIDAHGLREWDGFSASDSTALDGSEFSLVIDFADGSAVSARGSNRFPDGFSEAKCAIDELFRAYLEKNGITPEGG